MNVFVCGGTGYLGRATIPILLRRGHKVRVLARVGSEKKVTPGAELVRGNALDGASYGVQLRSDETFVQLVGVAHPSPGKAREFRQIDQVAAMESFRVAEIAKMQHFVYVSVAHPAPVMRAYWEVRAECEEMLAETKLNATVLRPWYVLGPGHWWPYVLAPFYKVAERIPRTAEGARRLGLVTVGQMADALVWAVENPIEGRWVMDVPAIRSVSLE